jgi:TorA maturation chaperone TorD
MSTEQSAVGAAADGAAADGAAGAAAAVPAPPAATDGTATDIPPEAREAIGSCGQVLGALFLTDPKKPAFASLREQLLLMPSFAEWPFGTTGGLDTAHRLIQKGLAEATDGSGPAAPGEATGAATATGAGAGAATGAGLAREYQRLFIGPHHFNAPAWGSVYLDKDQVLFGVSLLELRQWMRGVGITINEDKREPEDHIGKMLVLLGWLAAEKPGLVRAFLAQHLMPWAPRYLQLLRQDARQPFYEGLAVLTQETLDGIVETLGVEVAVRRLYF